MLQSSIVMVSEHFVRRCSVERSYMKRKKRHHIGTNSREGDNSLLNSIPCQQSKKKPKVQMLSIAENWLRMLTTDGLPSPLYWLSELISLKCHDSDHEDIYNKITVNSYISARLSGRPITIIVRKSPSSCHIVVCDIESMIVIGRPDNLAEMYELTVI